MLERAIEIAAKVHKGQLDKAGKPYILHPLRLMIKMGSEEEMIVAVLHDSVEDTTITLDELRKEGFSENIICAISAITKIHGETYENFIERIKNNPLATKIKIADLKDNSNLSRIQQPSKEDFERVQKYKKALEVLLG